MEYLKITDKNTIDWNHYKKLIETKISTDKFDFIQAIKKDNTYIFFIKNYKDFPLLQTIELPSLFSGVIKSVTPNITSNPNETLTLNIYNINQGEQFVGIEFQEVKNPEKTVIVNIIGLESPSEVPGRNYFCSQPLDLSGELNVRVITNISTYSYYSGLYKQYQPSNNTPELKYQLPNNTPELKYQKILKNVPIINELEMVLNIDKSNKMTSKLQVKGNNFNCKNNKSYILFLDNKNKQQKYNILKCSNTELVLNNVINFNNLMKVKYVSDSSSNWYTITDLQQSVTYDNNSTDYSFLKKLAASYPPQNILPSKEYYFSPKCIFPSVVDSTTKGIGIFAAGYFKTSPLTKFSFRDSTNKQEDTVMLESFINGCKGSCGGASFVTSVPETLTGDLEYKFITDGFETDWIKGIVKV